MIKRKKVIYSVSILLCLFLVLNILRISSISEYVSGRAVNVSRKEIMVIIDAGHGGVDGGAVASDSTLEKDINLDIALKLNEMLKIAGAKTILTRDSDVSIHDESAKTIRAKKVSDLHNRLKIVNQNPNYIFVSIHQNIYTDPYFSGAQVFYSPNNVNSIELAKSIQNSFSSRLQKENERQIKKCTTDVFLVYNAESVAVLCECGFMSNENELIKLKDSDYRSEVALCIFSGIVDYYSSIQ